jgi:hypothetical protein
MFYRAFASHKVICVINFTFIAQNAEAKNWTFKKSHKEVDKVDFEGGYYFWHVWAALHPVMPSMKTDTLFTDFIGNQIIKNAQV